MPSREFNNARSVRFVIPLPTYASDVLSNELRPFTHRRICIQVNGFSGTLGINREESARVPVLPPVQGARWNLSRDQGRGEVASVTLRDARCAVDRMTHLHYTVVTDMLCGYYKTYEPIRFGRCCICRATNKLRTPE